MKPVVPGSLTHALWAKFLRRNAHQGENRMSRESQTAGMMAIVAALLVPS